LNKTFRKKHPEDLQTQESVENHIKTVEDLYKLHMKKFNIVIDMMDPDNKQRYDDMRIKIRGRDENVPYFALYEQLVYNFREFQREVKEAHASSKKSIVNILNMIAKKSEQFLNFAVFATNIPLKELPLELKDFGKIQKNAFINGCKVLKSQWREYLVGEIQDLLRGDYNCYQVFQKFVCLFLTLPMVD